MDLNQYLDRMNIKTTIIRIHDVGKAYIRLLDFTSFILVAGRPFLVWEVAIEDRGKKEFAHHVRAPHFGGLDREDLLGPFCMYLHTK